MRNVNNGAIRFFDSADVGIVVVNIQPQNRFQMFNFFSQVSVTFLSSVEDAKRPAAKRESCGGKVGHKNFLKYYSRHLLHQCAFKNE